MELTPLHVEKDWFVDGLGRQVILRGVNLGGDSKVPFPNGGTQHSNDFSDHRTVSFIGRPFALSEADEHLARIAHWGFNCLRLLTTWEAVEHAGPKQYDQEYLDYFETVCRKAGQHGLYVIVDFHQDVWSRMSGGDGAPGWTFEAVGLDFKQFSQANAANVMQQRFDYGNPSGRQDNYPSMSWASNYRMPANGIMWTLFWAGQSITPEFEINGLNVQEFLQSHFLGAMDAVACRVKAMPHVIGFDSLNEPGTGWLERPLSPTIVDGQVVPQGIVLSGLVWSPLDCLSVAWGLPTSIAVLNRDSLTGQADTTARLLVNPNAVSIWASGAQCPFAQAGVYKIVNGQAQAINEDAFRVSKDGRVFNISEHAFAPFYERVAQTIRRHQPAWILFAEIDPLGAFISRPFPKKLPPNSANASHWYDITLLVKKTFATNHWPDLLTGEVASGINAIRDRYIKQLARMKSLTTTPFLVGEFGIAYDLDDGRAYEEWAAGNQSPAVWRHHVQALSLMYDALDALLLNSAQWNYTVGNRNDLRIGDQWNQEDLSIYSIDQSDKSLGLDSGARAIEGFCRPYARAVQGTLQAVNWHSPTGEFCVTLQAIDRLQSTEIFIPSRYAPGTLKVSFNGVPARFEWAQNPPRLLVWARSSGRLKISVRGLTSELTKTTHTN